MSNEVGKVLEKDEIERLAKDTLNEIPERRKDDIKAIKKWIQQQPHLKKNGKAGNQLLSLISYRAMSLSFAKYFLLEIIKMLNYIIDDKFILAYLRGCKFSYEKTKKKIDMWHAMRTHCPEYYTGWDPLEEKNNEILSHG
jgi:hypothetical protein